MARWNFESYENYETSKRWKHISSNTLNYETTKPMELGHGETMKTVKTKKKLQRLCYYETGQMYLEEAMQLWNY